MSNLISFLATISDDLPILDTILYIKKSLKTININVNWDHITQSEATLYDNTSNNEMPKKKMIFTANDKADFDNPLVRECNGIICEKFSQLIYPIDSSYIVDYSPNRFVKWYNDNFK